MSVESTKNPLEWKHCQVCRRQKWAESFTKTGPYAGQICGTCLRKGWFPPKFLEAPAEPAALVPGVYRWPLTRYQRRRLLVEHGHACAICGDATARLVVDHDHRSHFVRGFLCGHCNTALGFFHDHPRRLLDAIRYLQHPPLYRNPPESH